MPDLSLQHRFELITAPAAEPVIVTDAKKQMRSEHSDDNALIAPLINVAIGFVDVRGALGKTIIMQTWAEWLERHPSIVYASLGFHMYKVGSSTAGVDSVTFVIGDWSARNVRYNWSASDTASVGTYEGEFEVTFADSTIETFPNNSFFSMAVTDDLA